MTTKKEQATREKETIAALKPMREESTEQAMQKAQMDAAAGEAELDLYDIEEKNPEAVKLVKDWMNRHRMKAGYKRMAKVLAGTGQFMSHV